MQWKDIYWMRHIRERIIGNPDGLITSYLVFPFSFGYLHVMSIFLCFSLYADPAFTCKQIKWYCEGDKVFERVKIEILDHQRQRKSYYFQSRVKG